MDFTKGDIIKFGEMLVFIRVPKKIGIIFGKRPDWLPGERINTMYIFHKPYSLSQIAPVEQPGWGWEELTIDDKDQINKKIDIEVAKKFVKWMF